MATIEQDVTATGPAPESNADAVCVAVHIRPLVDSELAQGCQPCLTVTPGQPQVAFCGICVLPATLTHVPRRAYGSECLIESHIGRILDGKGC